MADSNVKAALAYLPIGQLIIAFVLFLIEKEDKFVKFHALQSLIFVILWMVVAGIVWLIVPVIVWLATVIVATIISIFTMGLGMLLVPLGMLIILAVWIGIPTIYVLVNLVLMYKAYKGQRFKLPVIGGFVENQIK